MHEICIDGNTAADKIADSFRQYYANIYVNYAEDKVEEFNKHRLYYVGDTYNISVTVENIEQAVNKLLIKKAAGIDGITSEHILYSHPCLIVHLKLLFHMMLLHGYVPNNFGLGIVVPILKDKNGDQTPIDNYRPVTLSPTISKILESVLLMNYGNYLYSDDRQFGFKKTIGCRNAIFVVRNVINYFNERGIVNFYGFIRCI